MTLDPHLSALLDAAAAAPGLEAGTVAQARAAYRQQCLALNPPQIAPAVAAVESITVPGGAGPLRARVYRPHRDCSGDGPVPTIAFYHGGGFVVGDLDTHDGMARELCSRVGAVVVSVDYRLSPEHPFPAAVDDAVASLSWIASHLADFGGDDRIAVAGDSAGANLAAVAATAVRRTGTRLAAALLVYPTTDVGQRFPSRTANGTGYLLEDGTVEWFLGHYLTDPVHRADPRVSPARSAEARLMPRTIVLTAEYDPLRDEGEQYVRTLRAAGVDATLRRCTGMVHGFFSMGLVSAAARAHIDAGHDLLRTAFELARSDSRTTAPATV